MEIGRRLTIVLLLLPAALVAAASPARADAVDAPGLRQITVDASVTLRNLRPFSGINGAPTAGFARDAHIDMVRTDLGGRIFPDPAADAENPKSYDFAEADRLIAAIKSQGAEPLVRIGANLCGGCNAPADADKYAQIARHVVLHFNQGWDRGSHRGIRYWEIWNEPDLKTSWAGSAAQYYALYERAALAIQSADPAALVGGPATSGPLNAGAYREEFMDYVRLHRLPLNFYSWHILDADDPYDFVSAARVLRIILDARGFGSTKNVLDAWNADTSNRDMSQAARAAFAASSLIYMLGGPVDSQTYAWAGAEAEAAAAAAARGGADTSGGPVGHALSALGAMKATPLLLQTTGGDDAGLAVIAGRSANGRIIQLMISNYQIPPEFREPRVNGDVVQYRDNGGYDATVTLPGSGRYRVQRYRISDAANFTLIDQSVQAGPTLHLQATLPPPGIEFIVISGS